MIGTNIRVNQDIAFPRQSVFPRDPSFDAQNRGRVLRRRTGRPFGIPGAQVVAPELGDIGDTIGGGSEVLGPGGEQGFPGGATPRAAFIPPPPFPTQPSPPGQSGLDRGLALGGLAIGGAKQVLPVATGIAADLAHGTPPPEPNQLPDLGLGDLGPVGTETPPIPEPPPIEPLPDVGELGTVGELGGAPQVPSPPGTWVPNAGLGDLQGGTSVTPPDFDIAADLESSFNPPSTSGETGGGFGLGDVAGGIGAAAGIASTAMSNRPDWQKALISSGQAGSFAAPAIAAQIGGQAAGGIAGGVAGGVGLAISLAMLGETLSKSNDANATEAQRIAADREKTKAVISAGASLASLGGSLLLGPAGAAIGGVISLGLAIDSLARMMDKANQGPPLGQNWTDYKSMMTAKYLGDQLPDTFTKATTPLQLLGVALSGPSLSPHGEVQIMHDTWGSGGSYDTPTSPLMTENLSKIAATGDPDLLREFIKGVTIKVGATGSGQDDWLATDTYRRQLVSLLPANHPVRLEAESGTSDLFQPPSGEYTAAGQIDEMIGRLSNEDKGVAAPEIAKVLANIKAGNAPRSGQPVNTPTVSSFFRKPGELDLTPDQRAYYIDRLSSLLPAPPASAAREFNPELGNYTLTDQIPDKLDYWLDPVKYMADDYYSQGGFNLGSMSGG